MSPQTWPERERKFIPPSLRGRRHFSFGGRTLQDQATDYGLYWVKFKRGCVGLKPGELFAAGDTAQVSGNYAMAFVQQDQAEFVRDAKIDDECRFLDEAKAKGYRVDGPPTRIADRPEFKALVEAKKKTGQQRWMENLLQRTPASS
jgi:hypothetical protein